MPLPAAVNHIKPMDPDIENTAVQLKELFAEAKREQTGRPYRPAARYQKMETWRAAAELCARVHGDPTSYVRAAFLYNGVPGGPFPNQLASNAGLRWYEQYKDTVRGDGPAPVDPYTAEIRSLFVYALQQIPHLKRWNKTFHEYLLDDLYPRLDQIPAFVRVMLLPSSQALRRKFGKLAYVELSSNPRLLQIIQELGYKTEVLEQL